MEYVVHAVMSNAEDFHACHVSARVVDGGNCYVVEFAKGLAVRIDCMNKPIDDVYVVPRNNISCKTATGWGFPTNDVIKDAMRYAANHTPAESAKVNHTERPVVTIVPPKHDYVTLQLRTGILSVTTHNTSALHTKIVCAWAVRLSAIDTTSFLRSLKPFAQKMINNSVIESGEIRFIRPDGVNFDYEGAARYITAKRQIASLCQSTFR